MSDSGDRLATPQPPPKDESIRLLQQVRTAVDRVRPRGEFKVKTIDVAALGLFSHSAGLFDAIALLAQSDLIEEALILARSLFEDSLRLQELEAAGEDRARLVFGWLQSSLEDKKGLMREARRLKMPGDQTAAWTHFADEERQLKGFAARNGVRKAKRFMSAKDAAQRFGRGHDFWTYHLSHKFVHGSDLVSMHRRRKRLTGAYEYRHRTADPHTIASLVVYASRSFLKAALVTAVMLSWTQAEQLHEAEEAVRIFDI